MSNVFWQQAASLPVGKSRRQRLPVRRKHLGIESSAAAAAVEPLSVTTDLHTAYCAVESPYIFQLAGITSPYPQNYSCQSGIFEPHLIDGSLGPHESAPTFAQLMVVTNAQTYSWHMDHAIRATSVTIARASVYTERGRRGLIITLVKYNIFAWCLVQTEKKSPEDWDVQCPRKKASAVSAVIKFWLLKFKKWRIQHETARSHNDSQHITSPTVVFFSIQFNLNYIKSLKPKGPVNGHFTSIAVFSSSWETLQVSIEKLRGFVGGIWYLLALGCVVTVFDRWLLCP